MMKPKQNTPWALPEKVLLWRDQNDTANCTIDPVVVQHSPTGFEWGYGGSGPADLALNLLELYLRGIVYQGETMKLYRGNCFRIAWAMHQDFKFQVIGRIPREGGEITYEQVQQWVQSWIAAKSAGNAQAAVDLDMGTLILPHIRKDPPQRR